MEYEPTSVGEARPDPPADPFDDAVDASTAAMDHARIAVESAADTSLAAREAALDTAEVARRARLATAAAVASAAASAAHLAERTAVAVKAEAVARAAEVALSAAQAREAVAAGLPDDADSAEARQTASAVASVVAADVVAQSRATADAAALVRKAVSAAADGAYLAAHVAADQVERAAEMAADAGRVVEGSSAETHVAAQVVVASTGRVAGIAPHLRSLAGLRAARRPADPMVHELHGALERSELRLHYQPIYDLQSGELAAVEALLRWQHGAHGLLAPASFLEVVESHPHLMTLVGDWVLTAAIGQAKDWRQSLGDAAPKIWVNISCDQLGDQNHLPRLVDRLLGSARLSADAIGLEITERQLIRRADEAVADLAALRSRGVSLAVDDFGTGYASLDYLRRFDFDEIKIDRSFVAGLGRDRTDTAMTSSIVSLARALHLNAVAEGIETQAQYDYLRRLGCAMGQGYLMHRPAAAAAIASLFPSGTAWREPRS